MDADSIIFIIIWAAIIIGSVVSASNRKKKEDRERRLQGASPTAAAKPQHRRPVIELLPVERPQQPAKAAPKPAAKPMPIEGERVTRTRRATAPQHQKSKATGLHDKENLKRAIIFGEVLAPKF